MSVLQGRVPLQLSKMFWASSENQMTDEKNYFCQVRTERHFEIINITITRLNKKRQYLIKFMTKKIILKPN